MILLLVYVLYLLFQLKSHSYLYEGTPQHIIDEATEPGILQRLDDSSSDSDTTSTNTSFSTNSTGSGTRRRVKKKLKVKLGRKRKTKTEEEIIEEEPSTTQGTSSETKDQEKSPANVFPSPTIPEHTQMPSPAMDHPPRAVTTPPEDTRTDSPATKSRMPLAARGLSFRPPPVFRGDSSSVEWSRSRPLPANQIRRLQSDQNVPRDQRAPYRRNQSTPVVPTRGGKDAERVPTRAATGASQPLTKTESQPADTDEPPLSQPAAIVLLLISTGLVALCAEFLVGSINHLVQTSSLSQAFIGLIILPIVGNAAEHVTAVTVAAKNKLDLALGVSLGSSIQIALFVTPLIVIIGWIMDKDMSLYFTLFETVSLFVSVFIVNFLVLDGRSNYLEGALLCACYVIIAVGTYYYPDGQQRNVLTGGPE